MIITHKLQPMDLAHKQNTIRVDVVQDDKYSRDVEFTLTENGVAWQIPDGTTAVVRYKKPDGTGGNYDTLPDGSTAYQINGNVLTVALAPQVCTVSGSVQLSVGLIKGNAEINTFTVNIAVQPNPGATYQSEDYIKLSGAVPNSGWTPNMYLGTDAQGNVVAKELAGGGGGAVSLDSTLKQSGKAADAKAVGDALATLENKIPTASGGMSVTAADLLVTILRNAEYYTDQSDNITSLATELNATPEPDIPDVPGGPDEPIVVRYAITNNLTECVNSNAATSLTEGASYTATLTASDGFVLDAVTVTMGGVDVTASVYADGVITIPSVTGDVVITASAVVVKTEELPFVSGQTYTVDDVEVTEGHIFSANGTITENNGFSYAVFPCRGANRAMFNSNIYTNYGVLMLDADKKYIRTVGITQTSGLFAENGITFAEISRDAEYIMFQCRSSNMQNITLELYQDPEYNGVYELNTWYRIPWRVGYSVNTGAGVISENADAMCSDYMSIYGATTIQISNGLRHFHVFYDADKNYLSTVTVQSTAPVSYNIPDGATYLVIAPPGGAQHHNCSIRITE